MRSVSTATVDSISDISLELSHLIAVDLMCSSTESAKANEYCRLK